MEATESALVDEYDLTGIITARVDKFLIIDDGQRLDSYQLDKDAKIIIDDIERRRLHPGRVEYKGCSP